MQLLNCMSNSKVRGQLRPCKDKMVVQMNAKWMATRDYAFVISTRTNSKELANESLHNFLFEFGRNVVENRREYAIVIKVARSHLALTRFSKVTSPNTKELAHNFFQTQGNQSRNWNGRRLINQPNWQNGSWKSESTHGGVYRAVHLYTTNKNKRDESNYQLWNQNEQEKKNQARTSCW